MRRGLSVGNTLFLKSLESVLLLAPVAASGAFATSASAAETAATAAEATATALVAAPAPALVAAPATVSRAFWAWGCLAYPELSAQEFGSVQGLDSRVGLA